MTGRIQARFDSVLGVQRKALIPFITAGDPDPAWTVPLMHALVNGGADLLELGVPFSDPTADGPVIQAASERAIERGVDLAQVLEYVRGFRSDDKSTPVVLMGYMNPVERYGGRRFARDAGKAGVDGLLLVDCPPEEAGGLNEALVASRIDSIRLVAPTTDERRLDRICTAAKGFIYYVSFKGITGADRLDAKALAEPIERIRRKSPLPVAVGFGISDPASAAAVAEYADAVVIGSALVRLLEAAESKDSGCEQARAFVASIRESLDNVHP